MATYLTAEELAQEAISLLVDGVHGIYAAQRLTRLYPFEQFSGLSQEDYEVLATGPDHEFYNESCNFDGVSIRNDAGEYHSVDWRDGDIIATNDDMINAWEDQTGRSFYEEMNI